MSFHPNLRLFGRLELLEVYDFHDTPLFVSCRNPTGAIYFAVAISDPQGADTWLYVPVSRERFTHVRSGQVDLHTTFSRPENGVTFLVTVPEDETVSATVESLAPEDLDDSMLPARGAILRLPTETLPQLDSAEDIAQRTLREIVGFKLKLPEYLRSEAPAKMLGGFLTGVQDTVNALASVARGDQARRGTFARDMLSLNELAVMSAGGGSFQIVLASTMAPDLFTGLMPSEVSIALEKFVGLISASGHADDLRERLADQPRVASHFLAMLRAIDQGVDFVSVEWASPQQGRSARASLSAVTVDAAIAVIEHESPQARRELSVNGRLVGANIDKKTFEIWSLEGDDRHFLGRIADEAIEDVNGAVLGSVYRARILQVEKVKLATGDVQVETTLVELLAAT